MTAHDMGGGGCRGREGTAHANNKNFHTVPRGWGWGAGCGGWGVGGGEGRGGVGWVGVGVGGGGGVGWGGVYKVDIIDFSYTLCLNLRFLLFLFAILCAYFV
jgi:hypothetical protein